MPAEQSVPKSLHPTISYPFVNRQVALFRVLYSSISEGTAMKMKACILARPEFRATGFGTG